MVGKFRLFRSFKGQPYKPALPIAFMHVPKTSGTSLTRALAKAIEPHSRIGGFDRSFFGGFRAFDSIDSYYRNCVYLDPVDLPLGANFVAGHLSYSTIVQRYGTAQLVTVLREPYSRVLSLWVYWRTLPGQQISVWGEWGNIARRMGLLPLLNFLSCRTIACQTDNIAVRMLLRPHAFIPNDDFILERHDKILIREASARLKRFAYTDVVENPKLKTNLQKWLGRSIVYPQLNATPHASLSHNAPLHHELTPESLELLGRRSRLDLKLWAMLASERISNLDIGTVRNNALLLSVARHSWLMAGQENQTLKSAIHSDTRHSQTSASDPIAGVCPDRRPARK